MNAKIVEELKKLGLIIFDNVDGANYFIYYKPEIGMMKFAREGKSNDIQDTMEQVLKEIKFEIDLELGEQRFVILDLIKQL